MRTVPLGEVLRSSASGYWGVDPQGDPADVQVIRNGDIKEDGVRWGSLPRRSLKPAEVAKSQIREGDILLTTSGECGQVAMITHDPVVSTCATNFVRILRFDDSVVPRYAFHYLSTTAFRSSLAPYIRGTTLKNLSTREAFAAVAFPRTGFDEQRRIATILDQAEVLRAKRRQALAHLDTLTQSIFHDMFGGIRDRVSLGEALVNAPAFTDGDWVESKDQDPAGDVRLTQLADVGDGAWLDKSSRYLTAETAKRLRCTFLQAGDVLLARMPDPLGRACVFPGSSQPCVTVVDVCVIRPAQGLQIPLWLAAAINSPATRAEIGRYATGTTRARVSRGNLAKVGIPRVPQPMQEEFVGIVAHVHAQRSVLQRALAAHDELFASLQARAFQGEL